MPPKRKAPATAGANEPPQTRRRTRSTATVEEPAGAAPAELPPPKRIRRVAKSKEDTTAGTEADSKAPVSAIAKETTRTTRTTRTRKTESAKSAEAVAAPAPSAPKRRGRTAKVRPDCSLMSSLKSICLGRRNQLKTSLPMRFRKSLPLPVSHYRQYPRRPYKRYPRNGEELRYASFSTRPRWPCRIRGDLGSRHRGRGRTGRRKLSSH